MILAFGKHNGKSVSNIVLKFPDYVEWMLKQDSTGTLAEANAEIIRLITIFDDKPFAVSCVGMCGNPATRVSVYRDSLLCMSWCDECNVTGMGASAHKLSVIDTYEGALHYVASECEGRLRDKRKLIRVLAEAKGLAKRVRIKQIDEFFD